MEPSISLHDAAQSGNLSVVHWWVSRGAALDKRNAWLQTPLLLAVLNAHWAIADYLLDHGADPFARDCRKVSVLELLEGLSALAQSTVKRPPMWHEVTLSTPSPGTRRTRAVPRVPLRRRALLHRRTL